MVVRPADSREQLRTRLLLDGIRQALLMMVDAIERYLEIEPRTAELRKLKR